MDVSHEKLESGEPFITAVFANWCPHCVKMKPLWAEFKTQSLIPIATFDYDAYRRIVAEHSCDTSRMLASSVSSFPHVALVRKIDNRIAVHVYDGVYPMTMKSLNTWVAQRTK
jgi:thiol-disulfide isomerase/thioredoxin